MATSVRLLKRQLRKAIQQSVKPLSQAQILEECSSLRFAAADSSNPLLTGIISAPQFSQFSKCVHIPFYAHRRASNTCHHRKVLSTRSFFEVYSSRSGKQVYVPFIDGPTMQMVVASNLEDVRQFPTNSWGIPEPASCDRRPNGNFFSSH